MSTTPMRRASDRGLQANVSRLQALVLFAFVVLAFVLLAWRSEINASNIRSNASRIEQAAVQQQQVACESGVAIIRRFNEQQAALARNDAAYLEVLQAAPVERQNPELQDLLADRIRIYEDAGQPLPDCDRLPEGDVDAQDVLDGELTAEQILMP